MYLFSYQLILNNTKIKSPHIDKSSCFYQNTPVTPNSHQLTAHQAKKSAESADKKVPTFPSVKYGSTNPEPASTTRWDRYRPRIFYISPGQWEWSDSIAFCSFFSLTDTVFCTDLIKVGPSSRIEMVPVCSRCILYVYTIDLCQLENVILFHVATKVNLENH